MTDEAKWYGLVVVALVLLTITVPRFLHFREYSDREAYEVCYTINAKCKELEASNASQDEWDSFAQEALPTLETIATDIEAFTGKKKAVGGRESGTLQLFQLARYDLPKRVEARTPKRKKTRGKVEDKIDLELAKTLKVMNARRTPPKQLHDAQSAAESSRGWDPMILGIVIVDGLLAVCGAGYWFWPKK